MIEFDVLASSSSVVLSLVVEQPDLYGVAR